MASRFNGLTPEQFAAHLVQAEKAINTATAALDHAAKFGSYAMVQQLERIDGQDDLGCIALRLRLLAERIMASEVAA